MPAYRLDIPPHVAETIRHLPPDLKRAIRGALQALGRDPALGEPLLRELEGLWKYRVRRFRIVYSVNRGKRVVRVFAVGHRRTIYETVAALVRAR
ncbi:MAG: type II toxin-antitoxin system RelE/ParE family toxin [candidate division NC10 bacterium]|nr:type II toxin-antitoxin system RelE/ParE family toxin [candidate division NC10 bacterium]